MNFLLSAGQRMIRDFYAIVRFAVRQKFRTGSFIPPEANGKGTFTLGKRDPNPYWFNMEIFAVIASNALKIRQVFSAAFSLYQQKSLKLNCSHLPMRCFSQDFNAEGCRQADACQIRQAERLQKHPSSGNACSSLACLSKNFARSMHKSQKYA